MSEIEILLDNRVRLVTAVLAASSWPMEEQAEKTHAVHPHAKQTRQFVQSFTEHEAVEGVNQALLNGVLLEELFSSALRCSWPDFAPQEPFPNLLKIEKWTASLADFAVETQIATAFWPDHEAMWQESAAALRGIFQDRAILAFLTQLTGRPFAEQVYVMPNLVYPALHPVLASTSQMLLLLLPPPKAVGESPPWPYDEDAGWVVAAVCNQLVTRLMADLLAPLDKDARKLFQLAATTLCLETTMDEFEAQAYLVRKKKEEKQPELPAMVERLRGYMVAAEKPDFMTLFG